MHWDLDKEQLVNPIPSASDCSISALVSLILLCCLRGNYFLAIFAPTILAWQLCSFMVCEAWTKMRFLVIGSNKVKHIRLYMPSGSLNPEIHITLRSPIFSGPISATYKNL